MHALVNLAIQIYELGNTVKTFRDLNGRIKNVSSMEYERNMKEYEGI